MKSPVKLKNTKKVAIVYRPETEPAWDLAVDVTAWLKEQDYSVFTTQDQKTIPGTRKIKKKELCELALVVVLGGDGTYLEANRILAGQKVPILGVNMGSLGFLTETRQENLYKALTLTLSGKMEFRPRAMIEVEIKKPRRKPIKFAALNDVVLERGAQAQLLNISITADSLFVCDSKSDGLVIATPTGSTAYNLAAGGPILHPEVAAFVVSPIAPHSLTNRPLLFPDNRTLSFRIHNTTQQAILVVDGKRVDMIHHEDEVKIRRSRKVHYIVRDPKHDYFSILREKLKFGQRS